MTAPKPRVGDEKRGCVGQDEKDEHAEYEIDGLVRWSDLGIELGVGVEAELDLGVGVGLDVAVELDLCVG